MKKTIKLILILLLGAAGMVLVQMAAGTSAARLPDRYGMACEESPVLEAALRYVETRPKYKSAYYASGYPDDGYGTCVDVIGIALRDCGYDLQQKVDDDIHAHPERYDIEVPDRNIDFRRVRNLQVYFSGNAISLNTDIQDIDAWQPGDIVVFHEHIGMISDRRNARGIPYVIHHDNPLQRRYEEDILEKRTDIIGHYRVIPEEK
ncbi:MAG: DUF1287 domain-containing protein [Solobacterium sp.]|nr:DUF1287 domain-containing protein [Solobacterium sp.]